MRRKRKRICLLLLVLLAIFTFKFRKDVRSFYKAVGRIICDETRGKQVIYDLCVSYRNGSVAGNLCEDLCGTDLLLIEECLSHKNDNVIFSANWRGKRIILKAKKMSSYDTWENAFPVELNQNLTALQETFLSVVQDHVILQLIDFKNITNHPLKRLSSRKLLAQLWFNASTVDLNLKEMQSLWSLLQQDEYFVFKLLQDLRHIPRIYGTCGQFYAVEQVRTLNEYIGPVLLHKSVTWRIRVKIAIQIIDLVWELSSKTVYGSWYHCDIQPSNFGLDSNGVVKSTDVDLMFTSEKILEMLSQQDNNCIEDKDCEFFDCASQCNLQNKKCTSKLITNNLQIVCRDLFLSKWIENGLLSDIPSKSKIKFDKILKECSAPSSRPWTKHKYKRILDTLNGYLTEELRSFN